jgi:hypothetical protein
MPTSTPTPEDSTDTPRNGVALPSHAGNVVPDISDGQAPTHAAGEVFVLFSLTREKGEAKASMKVSPEESRALLDGMVRLAGTALMGVVAPAVTFALAPRAHISPGWTVVLIGVQLVVASVYTLAGLFKTRSQRKLITRSRREHDQ